MIGFVLTIYNFHPVGKNSTPVPRKTTFSTKTRRLELPQINLAKLIIKGPSILLKVLKS